MADFNSVQFAKFAADPRQAVKVNEWGGRVRVAMWTYTATGDEDDTETIALVKLPRGARPIGGLLIHGAHTGADLLIGTEASPAAFLTTGDIALAGTISFLDTVAQGHGVELTADTDVIATVDTASLAVGEVLNGHILYVLD
jgi:hypothetical protein